MEVLKIKKVSELSNQVRSEIFNRIQSVRSQLDLILSDISVGIGIPALEKLEKRNFQSWHIRNTDVKDDIDTCHKNLLKVFTSVYIIFDHPPKLYTLMSLIKLTAVEKPYWYSISAFRIFFEEYWYREVYLENLKKMRNRKLAIAKTIATFNQKDSLKAWFRISAISSWEDILAYYKLDKRLHQDASGNRYGTVNEVKKFLWETAIKAKLLREISVWWWQWWWKNFAQDENKPEKISSRWFLLQWDVRLIRDLLKLETIRKEVIFAQLGL